MSAIENFRVNLASVMDRNGMSEYALNKITGITRSYINKVRHGAVMPSLEYCEKLAVGVKVPLALLILEQDRFERIMAQTVDKLSLDAVGELVVHELMPSITTAPAAGRPPKKLKPAEAAESHRRLLWLKKLLSSSSSN